MAPCHIEAVGPVAPQAAIADWLGLATPVWLGYHTLYLI